MSELAQGIPGPQDNWLLACKLWRQFAATSSPQVAQGPGLAKHYLRNRPGMVAVAGTAWVWTATL